MQVGGRGRQPTKQNITHLLAFPATKVMGPLTSLTSCRVQCLMRALMRVVLPTWCDCRQVISLRLAHATEIIQTLSNAGTESMPISQS